MPPTQSSLATEGLLRIVFDHSVVSRPFKGGTTLEEIARLWGKLAGSRYGDPVAISVTLGRRGDETPDHGSPPRH